VFGKKNDGVTEKQVLEALGNVIEPELHRDLVSLNMIRHVNIDDGRVVFKIMLTTPACPLQGRIEAEAREAVMAVPGVREVSIEMDSDVARDRRISEKLNLPVRNVVAVSSGKGGVGKSTVAANLAVALAQEGASVGLMDADFYGPNIPQMMGVQGLAAQPQGEQIQPPVAYGVKIMSLGFMLAPGQPVVWRGPMLHKAIQQFLADVDWGDLDYLIVDLPPGTGDAQMSLAQSVPLTGGVVVTTPQQVALADSIKGLGAFQQLQVPIIGIVENMSYFLCPHCGERTEIFDYGGGRRAAERLRVPFLGEIALDPAVRRGGDAGRPIVAVEPESPQARAFRDLAQAIAARVSVLNHERLQGQGIERQAVPGR
jgi:ATP-binding protein involved in chromosome partitioning